MKNTFLRGRKAREKEGGREGKGEKGRRRESEKH